MLKTCSCCGKEKNIVDFYLQSYTGIPGNQCKECILIKKRVARQKTQHNKFVSKEKARNMEEVSYYLEDWRDAMLHFGGVCSYCGIVEGRSKKARLERDHVQPISKGGLTIRSNIVPSCRKCNRGRGNKDWREWFQEQDFYCREVEARIEAWIKQ